MKNVFGDCIPVPIVFINVFGSVRWNKLFIYVYASASNWSCHNEWRHYAIINNILAWKHGPVVASVPSSAQTKVFFLTLQTDNYKLWILSKGAYNFCFYVWKIKNNATWTEASLLLIRVSLSVYIAQYTAKLPRTITSI